MSEERELEPGGYEAIQKGCTCLARDGEPQDNERWGDLWLTKGCPLHDPNAAPCEGCGECGRLCGG